MTIFRNPLDRVLSHIDYWRANPGNARITPTTDDLRVWKLICTEPAERLLTSKEPTLVRYLSNYQARQLSGSDSYSDGEMLERSLDALEAFDVVGLTSELPAFARRIDAVAGWRTGRSFPALRVERWGHVMGAPLA